VGITHLSWDREPLSPALLSDVSKSFVWCAECFLAFYFIKICLPKCKWCPKIKVKFIAILPWQKGTNVLNLSDEVKFLDFFLKGSLSLVEVGWHYGKINQASLVQYQTPSILSICVFSSVVVSLSVVKNILKSSWNCRKSKEKDCFGLNMKEVSECDNNVLYLDGGLCYTGICFIVKNNHMSFINLPWKINLGTYTKLYLMIYML
jgi:hypothetical protein